MAKDYTRWLNNSSISDDDQIFNHLYQELKKIAAGRVAGERTHEALNATALVHEAWMRLEKSAPDEWRDRRQFFAAAAEAMRRILVEAARKRLASKRGSGVDALQYKDQEYRTSESDLRLLDLHEVLDQLEDEDELAAGIVKLKFFGGMSFVEIGSLMELSERTVQRRWATTKVWLFRALKP
ncbi:ECF-type sigma factor [Haloferula chungangensis]|uniref:ECF-type sigma factor n=1 Tax=Haloferula chungangensis TaxID=1048331 RepID=A0ABW2L8I0_9BACT